MNPLGDELVEIIKGARHECLLAAPYIKRDPLDRLLAEIPVSCLVRVVTRWRVDEIAMGVSDLEVWNSLAERGNAELWLQPTLHAKYYRADERVAIGSANLTNTALGWRPNANLEILHDMGERYPPREVFEVALFDGSTKVDSSLHESFVAALEAFPRAPRPLAFEEIDIFEDRRDWRPGLRFPENLFMLYAGDDQDLSTASRDAAAVDLAALDPPAGLAEDQFKKWVGLALLQHPEFRAIDTFVISSRRFGEMRDFLAERGAADANRAWQTWMRWILHFVPERLKFHIANYSEIVSRSATPVQTDRDC
ncbi:phospholipase D family protein [Leptolyngbya sp. 15MV]|nr:phospholipase D family protein [Leptolyngbya sp. 15MV]